MSNIATTLEQSRRLLELGLDPKSADMLYVYFGEDDYGLEIANELDDKINKFFNAETIPAWSLSALLELMPKELEIVLVKTPVSGEYFFSWWADDNHMGDDYKDPVTTAYEMVVWLLENGYIERGGV